MEFSQKLIFLFFLAIFFKSSFAIELRLESNVEKADIFAVGSEGEKIAMGETPLYIDNFKITSDNQTILIRKEGYSPVYIPLSYRLQDKVSIRVELKALREWSPSQYQKESQLLAENLLDQVLLIQALLDNRKIEKAIPKIQLLKDNYPGSISVGVLYANSLLLSGKKLLAQAHYEELLEKIPSDRNTLREMVSTLNNQLKLLIKKR